MTGLMETVESGGRLSTSSHSPLGIPPTTGGIPHSHSSDDRLERGRERHRKRTAAAVGLTPSRRQRSATRTERESHRKEDPSSGCFRLMSIGKKLHFQAHPWIGICCCTPRKVAIADRCRTLAGNGALEMHDHSRGCTQIRARSVLATLPWRLCEDRAGPRAAIWAAGWARPGCLARRSLPSP